jgi:serine/alanine adding enzyme
MTAIAPETCIGEIPGTVRIRNASEKDRSAWNEFVDAHPHATNYHRWQWKQVIERSFGWPTYYLLAERDGRIAGVVPIVWQKSVAFGSFMTSLPFFSRGGIIAENRQTGTALFDYAVELAKQRNAKYFQLRHTEPLALGLKSTRDKITLVRPVGSPDEMMAGLDTKMRTNIRRSLKSGLEIEFGHEDLLSDFYRIFAIRMRELGTPVYSERFFAEILRAFPNESFICRVLHQGKPVSASFLTGYRDRLEANWSSSLDEFSSLKPNVFMYWKILEFAAKKNYTTFDFGRSTVGSGTHHFKLKWHTKEEGLIWEYWATVSGKPNDLRQNSSKFNLAVILWKRIPLAVTRAIGPKISRCLP